mgnify:CR=1 FL=1
MPNAAAPISPPMPEQHSGPLRLHIGGVAPKAGWRIVNVQPGPHVDYVGDIADLAGQFGPESVDELYASHILEHLGYDKALPDTLKGLARILKPAGKFYIAVPDMKALAQVFLHPKADLNMRIHVMRIFYGGRTDAFDIHYTGFDEGILGFFLGGAGFKRMERVKNFGLFDDMSTVEVAGVPVSLNVIASK